MFANKIKPIHFTSYLVYQKPFKRVVFYSNFEDLSAYSKDFAFSRARLNITKKLRKFENYEYKNQMTMFIYIPDTFEFNTNT